VSSQSKLTNVVLAAHTTSCFASSLNGWQQQTNQNADDGDHDQQFHKRETLGLQTEFAIHCLHHKSSNEKSRKSKTLPNFLPPLLSCDAIYGANDTTKPRKDDMNGIKEESSNDTNWFRR
jgi:hypothetical protein